MHYRNPDDILRQLEREHASAGTPETWLRIQQKRRQSGLPYERAYIIEQKINNDMTDIENLWENEDLHSYILMKTILSNGWQVETWYDDHEDIDGDEIGWTTLVHTPVSLQPPYYELDQVGSAVYCGNDLSDFDCPINCHRRRVASIIDGTIEEFDGTRPLENAEPIIR
jgi:hypothetical protein